jgi:predicted alpha/beta-hydrolase family hydrolase
VDETFEAEGISGILHRPDSPNGDAFALTHGAGSNARAPLLARMAASLAGAGYVVLRYDLPFRQLRPKGPPYPAVAAKDREGVVRVAAALRAMTSGRVFAGGHSYGGRQTAMAAAEQLGLADALLLLSYPLHPPGRPEQKRTAFFPELRVPALFVHGTQDPFGSPEELREAIAAIPARTDLLAVEGAGHDLRRAPDLAADILERLRALICDSER